MKQTLLLTVMLFIAHISFGQIGITSGGAFTGFTPSAATGINTIYLCNGMDGVTLTFSGSVPANVTWSRYKNSLSDAVLMKTENSVTASSISGLQEGYGYVLNADGKQTCVWLIDYSLYPVTFQSLTFDTDTSAVDVCSVSKLLLKMTAPELVYYTAGGTKQVLNREFTLLYDQLEWDAETSVYKKVQDTQKEVLSAPQAILFAGAPYCSTTFTIQGDQFATALGAQRTITSALYQPWAVITNPTTVMEERDNPNETKDEVELGGSGPVKIEFAANANEEAINQYEWEFSDESSFSKIDLRFASPTMSTLSHTFSEAGSKYVRLIASNKYCVDSASVFTVKVSDSFLDVPNFFTPGTTPDVNDEFRVVYKSLVKFHGAIVNRWGVKLFEWSDPAKGWDGKYNGSYVKPGAYFYFIEATGSDGKKYSLKGDVNILTTD
ncbi:MAG: gliding motility-associated C-terminal domain-containing protein [Bacteroidales bacterium]|nr:gliding motility-associated C-terminal domain-containing protein [Bacteroidales bacterium]